MSEDLIRRSDAIKAIEAEECLGYVECQSEWLYDRINAIPTIEAEEIDSTEIAKMVVHKMIENTTFAEDAYPDIKQKMHDAIENAPIVEPKRGRWIVITEDDADGYWKCSVCGTPTEAMGAHMIYNFCPNCGADMREREGK